MLRLHTRNDVTLGSCREVCSKGMLAFDVRKPFVVSSHVVKAITGRACVRHLIFA